MWRWNRQDRTLHQVRQGSPRNQTQEFKQKELQMNNIVYLVGAVVIVLAILSFLGFR
jgi:hypothetical protein